LNEEHTVDARYVRIELFGEQRTLTLNEVEVYSGGKNIAPEGKASQSTPNGSAARAIDGNKNPDFAAGGHSFTKDKVKDPWWELDFGKERPIGGIAVWNRNDAGKRLIEGFYLTVLDEDRKLVFKRPAAPAPDGSIHFRPFGWGDMAFYSHDGKKVDVNAWQKKPKDGKYWTQRDPVPVPDDYRDGQFQFKKGDRVALIGNALGERLQTNGDFEAPLQTLYPQLELSVRNLCISGDQVDHFPRSKGFTPMMAYLQHVKADVIVCFFGYNESFADKPEEHRKKLVTFVRKLRAYQPNGVSSPRIVLVSPIAHEDLNDPNLPDGKDNNRRLASYVDATRQAADDAGVAFVDLFATSKALYAGHDAPLTINGIHLTDAGGALIGRAIAESLSGKKVGESDAALVNVIKTKNEAWFERYRAVNGNDMWGSRSWLKYVDDQSNADVLQQELIILDAITANHDRRVWAKAQGRPQPEASIPVPSPVPVVSNVGGGSASSNVGKEGSLNYLSGQETASKLTPQDGYQVGLFADESRFPMLVNPVQMQVDTKGRLWAAAWPSYPRQEPLKRYKDALLIFEDDDKDGFADRCITFAEVDNPLGFEFWNGGVLVTSQPNLLFLKDTDGDDVADVRKIVLHGFGSSDSHHAANNLIYGPDGHIYWQSGVFLQHNHEHPWGPALEATASAMYRWDPRRWTIAHHANNVPNPHGISFDHWGYHYANDGTSGKAYQVRPTETGFEMHDLLKKEVRPVAAHAIVSSAHFPDDVQGDLLIANTVGFLGLKRYTLHRDGYRYESRVLVKDAKTKRRHHKTAMVEAKVGEVWGTPEGDFLISDDRNFRPTDAVFAEDGALMVSDWSNVIIGHMQHNVRDPNRDHKHGRIFRITYPGRPLQERVAIDGQPLHKLMRNLQHPVVGVRHRTRIELSERPSDAVVAAAQKWLAELDPKNPEHAHHFLEGLWLHQQHNVRDRKLLDTVLNSPSEHARNAAATVRHHWDVVDPALGAREIEAEKEMEILPGGLVSDTKELTTFRVNTVVEKMKYDVKTLEVAAGKKTRIIFANPDAMPHNLVIVKPGTANDVAAAAVALGAKGFEKKFIPESDDVIAYSDLIERGETDVLEFTAPSKPGDYVFVCTFPGHALLMRGTLKVR
jgi:putative membrane-bound dehydrogenase-like protein